MSVRGGSQVSTDSRAFAMALMRVMPTELSTVAIYPRLYELHTMAPNVGMPDPDTGVVVMPGVLPLSSQHMARHGVYLMDALDVLILWIGRDVPSAFITDLFDLPSQEALPSGKVPSFSHSFLN